MYITLKDFSEKHSWPSLSALRSIYFNAKNEQNEFLSCFRKVGKRVLINEEAFFEIVEKSNPV